MRKKAKNKGQIYDEDGNLTEEEMLTEEEINRRIDLAAKHTVKEYGHIIERLSKE